MRKISLNQICVVGLFTHREPSYWSCWHWRASVLLWLQKFGCAKALQSFLWGAQFSQAWGHQGRHWCPWDRGQIGRALTCGGSKKAFLGNTVEQSRSWICGWDHKCLYLHFQAIVLRPLWMLCCTVCSFTYIFKRKRWKPNGNRGLDF